MTEIVSRDRWITSFISKLEYYSVGLRSTVDATSRTSQIVCKYASQGVQKVHVVSDTLFIDWITTPFPVHSSIADSNRSIPTFYAFSLDTSLSSLQSFKFRYRAHPTLIVENDSDQFTFGRKQDDVIFTALTAPDKIPKVWSTNLMTEK